MKPPVFTVFTAYSDQRIRLKDVERILRSRSIRNLVWATLIAGTALILISSVPHFLPGAGHPFLHERPLLFRNAMWRACLSVHILSGMLCLPSGLLLLSRKVVVRWPGFHRSLGRAYTYAVILLMFPTGAYLACYTKGGLAGG